MKHVTVTTLLLLFLSGTLFLCGTLSLVAQPDERIDPRHPEMMDLPELGRMVADFPDCNPCGFGQEIYALGDVNGDDLADWAVVRSLLDTVADDTGKELLVYKGVKGGLPSAMSGQRIGPVERVSRTRFIAVIDLNMDEHLDIIAHTIITGDTIGGNTQGYGAGHLVIFWGNETGDYGLNDTTRLNNRAVAWLGPNTGFEYDYDRDGVKDLVLWKSTGLTDGVKNPMANFMIYKCGPGFDPDLPTWEIWSVPEADRISVLDQDCDEVDDIVFYHDKGSATSDNVVSILYGSPQGNFPDTTAIDTINLSSLYSRSALLSDITGDGVPELLANCQDEVVRIYAGEPGVRIAEQFGTGNEPPKPDEPNDWWGKPWAELWMPNKLHDGWGFSAYHPLLDLGDANLDGINDVWVDNSGWVIVYVSGPRLDSLIDARIVQTRPEFRLAVNLGDIDGTGIPTIAAVTHSALNHIYFVKPSKNIPPTGIYREPTHDPEFRCGSVSSVSAPLSPNTALSLQAQPNPTNDAVTFLWNSPPVSTSVTISIYDGQGELIRQFIPQPEAVELVWNTTGIPSGLYHISLDTGEDTATIAVQIVR